MENSTANKINLHDLDRSELIALFRNWGFSNYHAHLVWEYLYRRQISNFDEMPDLRLDLKSRLESEVFLTKLSVRAKVTSDDYSTTKYLSSLDDSQTIETVLMAYKSRATACVSTQVGCAMGCVFCATGQMGFIRHLRPGEIVAQVLLVITDLLQKGNKLRNVVFMGMGEPLHNYESTMKAIDIITDDLGLAIGPRFITLSTVGIVPAIRRLAEDTRPINLAVSLHAATDDSRNTLVPVNRRWPLNELIDACRFYSAMRDRRVFFEWALVDGDNDDEEQAHLLGKLLEGLKAHINLIPLNPTEGYPGQPTSTQSARQFQKILAQYDLPSTIRQRRGIEINAGCGQLRSQLDPTT